MAETFPRISVLVITYNQEKTIGLALDSLLSQKEYLYEICINDDCSKDHTWEVLKEYERKYPGLVKPVENEQNLGIFQNIEATWKRPSGDLVYHLSGDDECGEGFFKSVIEFIKEHHVDYKNELFCIYGDYILRFPDGKFIYYNQRSATRKVEPIRLKLRGLVSNRAACYSINIMRKFKNVSEGRSYTVESVQDCQLAMFTEKNYYVPVVGNIYNAAIGVSVNAKNELQGRSDEMRTKLLRFMEAEGIELNNKEKSYFAYSASLKSLSKQFSVKELIRTLRYYLMSLDFRFGFDTFDVRKLLLIAKRRRYYNN